MNGHAMSVWNERVNAVCGRFETRYDHCQSLFIGDFRPSQLGTLQVAHIRSNANTIARSGREAGRDTNPHCFLVLQHHGEMAIELGDRVVELREGDMALLDSAQALKMTPRGLFSHVSIHLPRERLSNLDQSRYGKLSTAGACGQLLATLVRQVAEGDLQQWVCAQDGDGLQAALVGLLGSVLEYPARDISPGLHLHEVQTLIQQRLDSQRLTPVALARELGISSRQLYRLFEGSGESVCRYILRERLLKAAQDLRNPAYGHRSITDIGTRWGFADSAHFSKTFKKLLGITPRSYRNAGCS
ncbi:transcriptional regulator FeaR [Pseudomonas sp. S36]|uniref:transcriptional regulator FeaR n=1 Tax=Pseudomonas sp. S36 TaxID=2767447 RepID=UPI0019144B1F|nr:transcriptional regulator FeaR [Pseudomonas sp. S36]MBK4987154.1 transcriptional regulator FeaR [Pseudomonas sp. S36]